MSYCIDRGTSAAIYQALMGVSMKNYILPIAVVLALGAASLAHAAEGLPREEVKAKTTIKDTTGIYTGFGSPTVLQPRAHRTRRVL